MTQVEYVELAMTRPAIIAWQAEIEAKRKALMDSGMFPLMRIIHEHDFPFAIRYVSIVSVADQALYQCSGDDDDCRTVLSVLWDTNEALLIPATPEWLESKFSNATKPTSPLYWSLDGEENEFPRIRLVGTPGTAGVTIRYRYVISTYGWETFPEDWGYVAVSALIHEVLQLESTAAAFARDLLQMVQRYNLQPGDHLEPTLDRTWAKSNRDRNQLHGH